MTDPNVSPYLKRKPRTRAEALADLVPPLEVPRPRDHQPVIDRHMSHPDAGLLRARDQARWCAAFYREQVHSYRRAGKAVGDMDWKFIRFARGRHSKAIATARAYDVLIAERDATRRVLG